MPRQKNHFWDDVVFSELPAGFGRETPQTIRRMALTQPVVISFWPDEKGVEQLDGLPNLKALVVVRWI